MTASCSAGCFVKDPVLFIAPEGQQKAAWQDRMFSLLFNINIYINEVTNY
jgi:hypothetical protein